MVGIVSGDFFGLTGNGSAGLGQRGLLGAASEGNASQQAFVNVATGNLVLQGQDDLLVSRGGDIGVVRTYNSQGTYSNQGADAWWRSGYHRLLNQTGGLNQAGSTIQRVAADGSILSYAYDAASQRYLAATGSGQFDSLGYDASSNQWTWTQAGTGNSETYASGGGGWRMTSSSDQNGNATTYAFSGDLLTSITAASGESVQFVYQGNNLAQEQVRQADGSFLSRTSYRYDWQNRLQEVKVDLSPADNSIADGRVYVTSYSYVEGTNLIASVTQTDGSELSFSYVSVNGQSEVASVTDALGRTVSFSYDPANHKTTVTDPYGNQNVYTYDASHRLTDITGPQAGGVAQHQQYAYDAAGNLVQSTDAQGNQIRSTFDAHGNLLSQVDGLGNRVEKTYDAQNRLLTSTLYQQPANGGQVASNPLTTRYVYDGNANLRFAISPEGRVVEYRYDSYGEKTSEIAYSAATVPTSGLGVGQAPSLLGMTTWVAAQDAQKSTRVDYQYNTRGQIVRTTTFARVDAAGAGIADGTQSVRAFTYDAAGNLLQSVDGGNNQTSFVYDGLNRLLSSTDAAGNVTVNQYDDADHTVRHILSNGRVDTNIYDATGQLVSTIQGGQAQAEYRYDALGRLILSIDPTGVKQHYFYDAAGNLQAQVDGTGQATAYVYNSLGQRTQTIRYATLLTAAQLADLDANVNTSLTPLPSTPPVDTPQWSATAVYTQGGRAIYGGKLYQANWYVQGIEPDVLNNGAWTEVPLANAPRTWSPAAAYQAGEQVTYAGQVYRAQWFVQNIEPGRNAAWVQVPAPGTNPTWSSGAEYQGGAIVAYNGRLWQAQWYSRGNTPDGTNPVWRDIGSAPIPHLPTITLPASSAADQISVTLYDAAGRPTWQVDPQGYVTLTQYDGASRITAVTQLATPIDGSLLGNGGAIAQALTGHVTTTDLRDTVVGAGANASHLLSATVAGASQLGGTVSFFAGQTFLGSSSVDSSGVATLSATNLTASAGEIRAVYSGDASNLGSASNDRTVDRVYDKDGLLRATIDGEGYLTEYRYNALGQRVQSVAYANAVAGFNGTSDLAALKAAIATAVGTDSLAGVLPASDAKDIQTFYYYDGQGQLVGQVDGEGYLTESVFDLRGNLTQTIRYANHANGPASADATLANLRPARSVEDHVTLNTWDALNRLGAQTNAEGAVTQYGYDSLGDVTSVTTAANSSDQRVALARYDAFGRVSAQLSAEGAAQITSGMSQTQIETIWSQYATKYTYDAAGRRTSVTDANGNRSVFFYEQDGRLRFTINASGEVQERQYDAFGNLSSATQYGSRLQSGILAGLQGGVLTGNAQSQQVQQALDAARQSGAAINSTTRFTYNAVNELVSTTDANGGVTSASYDTFGDLISTTQSIDAGHSVSTTRSYDRRGLQIAAESDAGGINAVTSAKYDAFGRLVQAIDANGNLTQQSFDRLGRVVQILDPTNAQRSSSYDAFGHVLTQIDALGNATQYSYSTVNRSVTVTTPEGVAVTTTHNAEGQTRSVTDGNGNQTIYTYDHDGNLIGTSSPLAQSSSRFDQTGRLIETTDANGNEVVYTYDAANRLLSRTVDPNGLGLTTYYQYDAKGEQISVTDANGTVTQTSYDLKGQVLSQTVDPSGLNLTTIYTYDDAGRVLTVTDPKGTSTQYVYDALGRRVEEHVDPAGLNLTRRYAYDAAGNVVSATDAGGNTTHYAYDADSRLVYTVDASGDVQQNSYDALGRLTATTTYAGRISLAGLNTAPSLADIASRVVAAPGQDASQSRVYDKDGRLHYTLDATGSVTRFTYDANGNVVDRAAFANTVPSGTPPTEAALAAAVSGLADASRDAHVRNIYDAGNRLVWSADGTGAVTRRIYDANGNLVKEVAYATPIGANATPDSVTASTADRVTLMAYDSANRLAWQIDALGGVTQFVYDADGNGTARVSYANRIAAPTAESSVLSASGVAAEVQADPAHDRVTRAVFDAAHRQILSIDGTGAVVETRYDADGNAIATTAYANRLALSGLSPAASEADIRTRLQPNAESDRTTQRIFDASGRQVYTVNALGYVQQTQYDGAGRVLRTILYAAPIALTTPGTVTAVASALSTNPTTDESNTFNYDAAGRLISSTDALGATETYTWNGVGDKLSYTNKNGATWTYGYDAAGRLTSETSPAVSLTTVGADGNGNLAVNGALSGAASIVTRLAYDALGNLVSRTEAAGRPEERTTQYRYDALGRQVQTIYPSVAVYNAAADDLTGNGANGVGVRTEIGKLLTTQVVYDAFGDAVANIDVAGNASYKAYDNLGRVSYDVDALGYVTGFQRNTFGDVTTLTRYAAATNLPSAGGNAPSSAQIVQSLSGLDHGADRAISTQYDRLGRAVQVTEPQSWVNNGNGQGYLAAKVTRNTYNAFGQVVQSAVMADTATNTWATTTHYFDRQGQETATVDALGYVTTQAYDASGNVVRHTEYANAAAGWTTSSLVLPTPNVDDRTTTTSYDRNNRKTGETRVGVEFSSAPDGTSTRGDVTTTYGYDAVGNLTRATDALNNSTYTYYDALGRTVAVAAPARNSTANGASLTPLTVFRRDAYGNVVVKIDYARGAASASAGGFSVAGDSAADHVTLNQYDSHGNVIQTADANGVSHYLSYDALGHLAKQWLGVTGNDGVTHTLFTLFQYDALGRQTDIITPASTSVVSGGSVVTVNQQQAGVVHTRMAYNGFGEMILRGTSASASPEWQEHFDYDAAGRQWRTNSGDGVEKVMLYDLQGHQTASIASAGSQGSQADLGVDLGQAGSAQQVDQLTAGVRRTDSGLDLLGHALQQTLPGRYDSGIGGTVRPVVYQTFDRWGNVVSQSDVRSANWVTTFRYNANNQVVQEVQPDGNGARSADSPVTQLYYDALGRQVAVRDANGQVNGQVWDAAGNLRQEIHSDGGVVTHRYDAFGNQLGITDAMGYTTTYGYDKLNHNTSITSDVVGAYSADGNNAISGSQRNLVTSTVYDQAGRKIRQTNGNGETTQFTYDLRGNVIATTQPLGEVSRAAFDAFGRQIGELDANGALSTWSYDAFGELQGHTDIGGAGYWFHYDSARQLIAQGNSRGQNLAYSYDAAGQLTQIVKVVDNADRQTTLYAYNAAGKHVREQTIQGGQIYQDQTLAYDTLGRLAQVNAIDGVSLHFDYDKVGNRLHQHTTWNTQQARVVTEYVQVQTGTDESGAPIYTQQPVQHTVVDTVAHAQDLWYAYDVMNRQILVDGAYNGNAADIGNITSGQGHILSYDRNGNRTSDTTWGEQVVRQETVTGWDESGNVIASHIDYVNHTGRITEFYTYDRMNRLATVSTGAFDTSWNALPAHESIRLDTRLYDGASRVVQTGPNGSLSNDYIQALTNGKSNANGAITRISRYDADGRLLTQHVTKPDGAFSSDQVYEKTTTWQTQEQVQTGTDESGTPIYATQTVTHTATSSGYDAAGNVVAYRSTDSSGVTSYYDINQARFDGYKEGSVVGHRSDNTGQNGTTTDSYDVNGFLTGVADSTKPANDRSFVNDVSGHILQKTQQGNVLKELVIDGQEYGVYGSGVDPVTPANGNGDPNYVAQGDFNLTYQPITNTYPAASTGQYSVRSGDTLQSIAQAAYGDSQLWYQIADANGLRGDNDLRVGQTLTIPSRVGSAHNTSNTFKPYDPSKVVGDTTPNLPVPQQDGGGGCGALGSIIVMIAVVAVTAIAQQYEAIPEEVSMVLGGAAATEATTPLVLTSVLGPITGQLVGMAIGVQHGFDWKQVAMAAISFAVTEGVGAVFGAATNVATAAAEAAVSSAMTQGIGVATGLQSHFDWMSVAASAVGAGVGRLTGDSAGALLKDSSLSAAQQRLVSGVAAGVAGGFAAQAMHGGRIDVTQVAVDAFGNALGGSLASNSSSQNSSGETALGQVGGR
ncbi:carbohydrate-binding protein, partial [Cupriavidus sp. 8B]